MTLIRDKQGIEFLVGCATLPIIGIASFSDVSNGLALCLRVIGSQECKPTVYVC